jgi:predicted ArsR family transcriptional regulator
MRDSIEDVRRPSAPRSAISRCLWEAERTDCVHTSTKGTVMSQLSAAGSAIQSLPVALERDVFLRNLIRELAGTLQDVVGLDEAAGFISIVGQRIGDQINQDYKSALQVENLDREQVAQVLVDLKRRIQGTFYVIEESDEKIVLGNRSCPFAEKVIGRPAMCMMTSNVFGVIAAENLGQAKVVLEETIAAGAAGCRVTVYLKNTDDSARAKGREYFKS